MLHLRKTQETTTTKQEIINGLQRTFAPERIVPQVALAATLGVASQVGAEVTAKVIRARHRKQWGDVTPEQLAALANELSTTSASLQSVLAAAEAKAEASK